MLDDLFRENHARLLAALIAFCRDFSLAEEALQDAMLAAWATWPEQGEPTNPPAWLLTIAKRKIIDQIRRDRVLERKLSLLGADATTSMVDYTELDMDVIPDERLRLIFTCCHPALARDAQVALTLRTLGGLSTEEIAHAFLVPTPTMAQRLVRAQRKITDAGIPYEVPGPDELAARVDAVLVVLYLIFNEGYAAARSDTLIRHNLCSEAIRLVNMLERLVEHDNSQAKLALRAALPEILGLAALMILTHARSDARIDADGALVLLEDQDRGLWDAAAIKQGVALLDRALAMRNPGPYQIQAAIGAVHCEAPTAAQTDWMQIAALYGALHRRAPSPIVILNRAIAMAMACNPRVGLDMIAQHGLDQSLDSYHHFHAARADLLGRLGDKDAAAEACRRAIDLCENGVERRFLERRLETYVSQTTLHA